MKDVLKKWWFWVIAVIVLIWAVNGIGSAVENAKMNAIELVPNVMAINYEDAIEILESEGFEVTAVEADAKSTIEGSGWDRSVNKGDVFKVNDKINLHYSDTKSDPMAEDGKVTIYYAKEDYVYVEPEKEVTEEKPKEEVKEAEKVQETAPSNNDYEWKEFLADYEAFMDSYVEIMKKYKADPTDMSILADYTELSAELVEWSEKTEKMQDDLENSPEALKEYLETLGRITEKMSELY